MVNHVRTGTANRVLLPTLLHPNKTKKSLNRTARHDKTRLRAISVGVTSLLAVMSQTAFSQTYLGDPGLLGVPASWQTPEFKADWGLGAMNMQYAYAAGVTGKGVNVGVVDSGFYLADSEFKNRPIGTVTPITVTGVASQTELASQDIADPRPASDQKNLLQQGQPFSVPADQLEFIHGTHVLGIIGANRDGQGVQGGAYDANLIVANTNGTDGLLYDENADYNYFKVAYDAVTAAGARVINSSWGQNPLGAGDLRTLTNAYQTNYQGKLTFLDAAADQARKGVIMVWTAGNSGFANPSLRASLPYFEPELAGHWVAAAWLDSTVKDYADALDAYPGELARFNEFLQEYPQYADFLQPPVVPVAPTNPNDVSQTVYLDYSSNKCGIAKYWCISAPGGGIQSTAFTPEYYPGPTQVQPTYVQESGTSMAAPQVTAAIALLMARYPYLGSAQNAEILQILFTTAHHLNADPNTPDANQMAPNSVFGWGIPDLQKGMNGPGQLGILMTGDSFLDGQPRLINPVFDATLPGGITDVWTNDISGPGGLLKEGAGTLALTGTNIYTGATTIKEGSLEIDGSLASPVTIQAGGALAGHGVIIGSVENAGTIAPGAVAVPFVPGVTGIPGPVVDAPAHGVLTIRGAYEGIGGLLKLNTVLGDDKSASDKLVIDGTSGPASATGKTGVFVTNVGGAGANTLNNGIMVVQTLGSATTDAGAFSLVQGVRAGAYDYRLFRGGIAASDASTQHDWFLRSTFVPAPVIKPVTPVAIPAATTSPAGDPGASTSTASTGTSTAPVNGTPAPAPAPAPVTAPAQRIVGPELSVYGSAAPTAMALGMSTLASLHERTADRSGDDAQPFGTPAKDGRDAWARVIGQSFHAEYGGPVAPSTSGGLAGVQAGTDVWAGANSLLGGKDRTGVYFAYAHSHADVQGLQTNAAATANVTDNTGNLSLDGWSLGGYWTHTGEGGWYTDLVGQGTLYSGKAASDRTAISLHGHGVAGSLEFGYPIAITPRWSVEPNIRLLAQRVQFGEEQDAFTSVSPGNTSGVFGSVGVRAKYKLEVGHWLLQPYVFTNLWSSLGGVDTQTNYGGEDQVNTYSGGSWVQAGGGLSASVTDRVKLYARLSGVVGMGGNARHGIDGSAGVQVAW